jgi:hypothetical protein
MGIAAFIFIATAYISSFSYAGNQATDPAWLALLHNNGSGSSVKEGSSFFLSPSGHEDPQAELEATLRYFEQHPEEAACRFPARALYLQKTTEGKSELCDRWRKWREAIHARGAELVFAAAFLASPSSMYGHTLLKFVRGGKTAGEDLLDYTLNYGAKTGNTVGLPYVWKGLTGGFDGNYATAPFYLKVKEYNFVENRDFWIYPLKLSEGQLRLLVAHSWEIRDVDFPYFFLHRNCSLYLLELLEVLRPGSRLVSHFPFWTVPVDTIRLLEKEGWLEPPRYRASRYTRLRAFREQLTGQEIELVEKLAEGGAVDGLPPGREGLVLDSAYELWRYRTEGKKSDRPSLEAELLRARARYPGGWKPDFSAERPPEKGHPSSRLGLAYGENREHSFLELQYRGTLHDLLANPHGYENHSELSMGDLRLRYEHKKVFLERFDLLRLRSVAPSERWIPRSAWSFRAGAGRAKEFACAAWQCLRGNLEGGYGAGLALGPVLAFALAETKLEAGSVFDRGFRWGAGPTGGLFTPLWKGSRLLLEGEWRWRLLGSDTPERAARVGWSQELPSFWEARLEAEARRAYREASLSLFHYF